MTLFPEVKLALAHSYDRERNWPAAIQIYEQWVVAHTNHYALPHAQYYRALALDEAGNKLRAYEVFTNFTTRFPTNSLAPLAENWVADYYYNQSEFEQAELTRIPKNTIRVDGAEAKKVLNLMEALEDNDDVQNVYANFDISEEYLESGGD